MLFRSTVPAPDEAEDITLAGEEEAEQAAAQAEAVEAEQEAEAAEPKAEPAKPEAADEGQDAEN